MNNKHVGEKHGDMLVIEHVPYTNKNKTNLRVVVECSKCRRRKEVSYFTLAKKRKGVYHKSCTMQVDKPEHFHSKWEAIRQRTTNPNHNHYHLYGGRGINSDAWKFYVDFYDDMYESYLEHVKEFGKKDTTIDRIDVNGNYCKENCRWSTCSEQMCNTRRNKWFKAISPNGIEFVSNNQKEFAETHNLNSSLLNSCLNGRKKTHKGWTFSYI